MGFSIPLLLCENVIHCRPLLLWG